MRFRSSNVRTKIVALLLSLFALWAFAAYVTLREGLNLLSVSTFDQNIAQPGDALIPELQQERRLSLIYLSNPRPAQRRALAAQRVRTDEARARFEASARSGSVKSLASDELEERIDDVYGQLAQMGTGRAAIDSRTVDRPLAALAYTNVLNSIFQAYDSMATVDDKEIAKDIRTLIELVRARELLSQEDARVAGILAAGRFTSAEHYEFVQIVGAHRFYSALASSELPEEYRARYDKLVGGSPYITVAALEERLIRSGPSGSDPPVGLEEWDTAVQAVLAAYQQVILDSGDDVVGRATPVAIGVVVRLILAGGLGLVALVASIIVSITTARTLVRQLQRLRAAAWELANTRLPSVVERLRAGEKVDVAAESPPLAFGGDEIGQVGQAINAVQETAIRAAVEQAELRTGVRDLFLGLARRNQALVHRQLSVLDEIERRETDAHELADLFKVDHLATRMRRNAENLIVLSGAVPGRRWRNPIPFVDVVRGAVAEVEDYTRVAVLPIDSSALAGRAVSDVIHLLAELIENAASFSPPYTMVNVGGQKVANGFVVEIEDRGLGMSEAELAAANELVSDPPEFNLTSTARLGLYVVGRLAVRHGIDVQLRRSPYGGTMAIVLIPSALVVTDEDADGAAPAAVAAPEPAPEPVPELPAPVSPAPVIGRVRVVPPTPEPPALPALPTRSALPAQPVPSAQPAEAVTYTPSGLPWRVRQASLAAPLRDTPPPPEADPPASAGRTPAETRSMMASYQSATRRGRADAERQMREAPPASAGDAAPVDNAADSPVPAPSDDAESR